MMLLQRTTILVVFHFALIIVKHFEFITIKEIEWKVIYTVKIFTHI